MRAESFGLNFKAKAASQAYFLADKSGPSERFAVGRKRGLSRSDRRAGDYYYDMNGPGYDATQYTQWLDTLFPGLPPVPAEPTDEEPKEPWPAEAKKLAESLLRNEQLARLDGGLRIERRTESFDPRFKNLTSRSETLALVSPGAWLIRSGGGPSQTLVAMVQPAAAGHLLRGIPTRPRANLGQAGPRSPAAGSGRVCDRLDRSDLSPVHGGGPAARRRADAAGAEIARQPGLRIPRSNRHGTRRHHFDRKPSRRQGHLAADVRPVRRGGRRVVGNPNRKHRRRRTPRVADDAKLPAAYGRRAAAASARTIGRAGSRATVAASRCPRCSRPNGRWPTARPVSTTRWRCCCTSPAASSGPA